MLNKACARCGTSVGPSKQCHIDAAPARMNGAVGIEFECQQLFVGDFFPIGF
jgi:hypothetical protein